MSRSRDAQSTDLDEATRVFIEDFAYGWSMMGNARMEGRVLGLLLIVDEPYLSSSQIAEMLQASTGAVSMSTRALVSAGFLKPHSLPGDRNHYFRAEDDVWGSFLAGEREYLTRLASTIDFGLDILPETTSPPRTRLGNARRYMTWLAGHHRKMLAEWEKYRDAEDTGDRSAG